MKHIEGIDRDQLTLMPDTIEDYIAGDNPVRFLDTSVESLDLKGLGFPESNPNRMAARPIIPAIFSASICTVFSSPSDPAAPSSAKPIAISRSSGCLSILLPISRPSPISAG